MFTFSMLYLCEINNVLSLSKFVTALRDSASEMTYIVPGRALNSTHSLLTHVTVIYLFSPKRNAAMPML